MVEIARKHQHLDLLESTWEILYPVPSAGKWKQSSGLDTLHPWTKFNPLNEDVYMTRISSFWD